MNSMKVLIWCRHITCTDPPGLHWSSTVRAGWLMANEFFVLDLAENDPKLMWLQLTSLETIDYNKDRLRKDCYNLYNYMFIMDWTQHSKVLQRWAQDSESS